MNVKQCRSRSVGFFSQLIWIYTVCKERVCPGSAGLGLNDIGPDKVLFHKKKKERKQKKANVDPFLISQGKHMLRVLIIRGTSNEYTLYKFSLKHTHTYTRKKISFRYSLLSAQIIRLIKDIFY